MKITNTMKMVSSSKLRKAHRAQANAKLYIQNVELLTSRIVESLENPIHPLFEPHSSIQKASILVITSDKGLCGAFNHNAHRHVLSWLGENGGRYAQIDLICCGKKGFQFFKNRMMIKKHYEEITQTPQFVHAMGIGKDLEENFLSGQYDEIYLAYNQFSSPLLQKTIFERILPIDPETLIKQEGTRNRNYLFEPSAKEALEFLIPHFLYFKVYFALLENSAGEHGARMSAMGDAARNA